MLPTWIDMAFELTRPYMDLRVPAETELSIAEIFWLLSGETEQSLKPGRRVQATVMGLSDLAAYCTLPDLHDIEAVILSEDISSSGPVQPSDRLRRGDTVAARSEPANSCIHSFLITHCSAAVTHSPSPTTHQP